jgi:hypothetical protein
MLKNLPQENQSLNDSVFVVSSAIHAKFGVYSTEERLNQTIETCKSIRSRVPADIIVLDGGISNLNEDEKEKLKEHITLYYSFSESQDIKEIQKISNWDIVKNSIEIIMFGSFFDGSKDALMSKYKRIFKISGRYTLTDSFNYEEHMNAKDKIVIRGPYTSQFEEHVTGGVTLQYMSRLWSFDSSLVPYVSEKYEKMYKNFIDRLNASGYIDIEHLLYAHLDVDKIHHISKIGISGNIAPNGHYVEE